MKLLSYIKKINQSLTLKYYSEPEIVNKFIKINWNNPSEVVNKETKIWYFADYVIKHSRYIRGDVVEVYNFDKNKKCKFGANEEIIAYVDQSYQYDNMMGINDVKIVDGVNKQKLYETLLKLNWSNKENIMSLVKENGNLLQYCNQEIKSNKEVCIEAVKSYGNAIKYVSNELKKDVNFALVITEYYVMNIENKTSPPVYSEKIEEYIKELKQSHLPAPKFNVKNYKHGIEPENYTAKYLLNYLTSALLKENISYNEETKKHKL